jgi:NitT/TauT family transport system substrate-binding protein
MATVRIHRRTFLATSIVSGFAAGLPRSVSAAPLREVVLTGPPAGPSITLAHAVATGALSFLADKVTFKAWRDPDEMRAGLTSGTMPLVIMPTAAAANLHNRGLGLRLVNVMTNGLLHVIAADPALTSLPALKGLKLAVPFRNDTPEFVARRLLAHHGLVAGRDLQVDTTGTPIEAIQLLLAGRTDAALVPEPAATAAILRGALQGKIIHRVMDIQVEWAKVAGGPPVLPQAGLAVTDAFLRERRALVERVHAVLIAVTATVNATPSVAAAQSAAAFELPQPVIERAIPYSKLVATAARDARDDLERMYKTIADGDPAVIGGKLPGEEFYL